MIHVLTGYRSTLMNTHRIGAQRMTLSVPTSQSLPTPVIAACIGRRTRHGVSLHAFWLCCSVSRCSYRHRSYSVLLPSYCRPTWRSPFQPVEVAGSFLTTTQAARGTGSHTHRWRSAPTTARSRRPGRGPNGTCADRCHRSADTVVVPARSSPDACDVGHSVRVGEDIRSRCMSYGVSECPRRRDKNLGIPWVFPLMCAYE